MGVKGQMNRSGWVTRLNALEYRIARYGYDRNKKIIEKLATAPNAQIRADLAILLCQYVNKHSEAVLISLLHDKSLDVQIEAADSLSSFCSFAVFKELKKAINSGCCMLRAYAIRGIGYVTPNNKKENTIRLLYQIYPKEINVFAKIQILFSLYLLGDKTVLPIIIKKYDKCSYRNKCAIVNGLADLVEENVCDYKSIERFVCKVERECLCDAALSSPYKRLASVAIKN